MQAYRSESTGQEDEVVEFDRSSQQPKANGDPECSSTHQKMDIHTRSDSISLSPKPVRDRALLRFGWWWELAATLLSLVSVTLIMAILLAMDGKPLQHWKLPIQINSLVAVFSTFARSSLFLILAEGLSQLKWNYIEKQARTLDRLQVFDDASRGPWGAFTFFFKMKQDVYSLAAIGAALTVLALAIDPFTQQILEFPSRGVSVSNGTAYLYTAEEFALREWSPSTKQGGPKLTITRSMLDLIVNPSPKIDPYYVCPNGDCEIPAHWSLAACTTDCEDNLQDALECNYIHPKGPKKDINLKDFKSLAIKDGATEYYKQMNAKLFSATCWTESSTPDVQYWPTTVSSGPIGTTSNKPVWHIGDLFGGESLNLTEEKIPEIFTNNHILSINRTIRSTSFPEFRDLDQWPGIIQNKSICKVSYCVKEKASTIVKQGRIQDNKPYDKELPLAFSNSCGMNMIHCSNITATFKHPTNGTWNIQMGVDLQLQFGMYAIQVLHSVTNDLAYENTIGYSVREMAALASRAISSFMRSPHNAKAKIINSDAIFNETYVRVRWQWAILPIFIVPASVTFLVLVALETRSKMQLFKSSVLIAHLLKWEQPPGALRGRAMMNRQGTRMSQYIWKDLFQDGIGSRVKLAKKKEGELIFM